MNAAIKDQIEKKNEATKQIYDIAKRLTEKEKIDGTLRNEDYSEAFDQINKLGQIAFETLPNTFNNKTIKQLILKVGEKSLPYLEHTIFSVTSKKLLRTSDGRRHPEEAIRILGMLQTIGIPLLTRVFREYEDSHLQIASAYELLRSEQGFLIVKEGLYSQNDRLKYTAVYGIAWVVSNAYYNIDRGVELGEKEEHYITLLSPFIDDKNPEIRERVLRLLVDIKRIDIRTVDKALDDKDINVRNTALRGLSLFKIDTGNATTLVKVFEDPSNELSTKAIDGMFKSYFIEQSEDAEAISNAIIELLILRTTKRPSEYFNPIIVVKALEKTFENNPRLYGQTLNRLCDLAYEKEGEVLRRCVFVAKRINKDEFLALVNERAKLDPEKAKIIFQTLGLEISLPSANSSKLVKEIEYIDYSRLDELRALRSIKFDLTKLIKLCEDLNVCYSNECYLAVIMLTRAVLDHIPPIFDFETFVQVANNYGKPSFKKSMQHLQNSSRSIADNYLHEPIRKSETLPNKTQVNFSNDLDVLLGEIVRLLK